MFLTMSVRFNVCWYSSGVGNRPRVGLQVSLCVRWLWVGKKILRAYLLSHEVRDVSCFHFEGAVLCPEINRIGYACATPLIDLVF